RGDPPDGSSCTVRYSGVINFLNKFGQTHTGLTTLNAYDYLRGMYHTAQRYMRCVGNTTSCCSLTVSGQQRYQNAYGMPVIEDWYKTGANSAVTRWNTAGITVGTDADPILYRCQTNVFLGIGDTATNNEDASHSGNGDIESSFV